MPHTEQLATLIAEDPHQTTMAMAETLGLTEGALIRLLPAEWVTLWSGEQAEALLLQLSQWGALTTIVESDGSIFEFKGVLPAGKTARGYYNLMGDEGLHGHLKLDGITHIALLSKPFMGKESYAFAFIAASGRCAFKIYLGRNADRRLLADQVTRFQHWRQLDSLPATTV